ncbi:MAG: GNAT family N-acetyltransferase [Clostridiales bacterium]|jgi:ribosomal protein S18 acetylase RimI-like enzyme|nr:GNAT family N-acetyltransferase [Clostridiales bacterium]
MCLGSRKIEIRLISETDLIRNKNILIHLLEDNLKNNFPNINNLTKFVVSGYEDMVRFKQNNSAILIGAFEEETIIGFLWAYKRDVLGEKRMHVGHIVVNSAVRSCGIGLKLLKKLEYLSRQECIKKLELMTTVKNESTIKFYTSYGFSIVRVQLEKELGETDDNR